MNFKQINKKKRLKKEEDVIQSINRSFYVVHFTINI